MAKPMIWAGSPGPCPAALIGEARSSAHATSRPDGTGRPCVVREGANTVLRRSPRLSLRFVAAAALLGCLVSALPFRGQVHAATEPQSSGVIALNHHVTLSRGTFVGNPGATISVRPNGLIT